MSQAYYQGYGTQLPTNYNNGGDGSVQHLNYHNPNFVNEEYMRQPATAPYPTAPVDMPQPNTTHHLHHHVQPSPPPAVPLQHHQQEPQVIIVHQNSESDCCCECFRHICSCLNGIVSGVCQIILAIIFFVGIIAIAVYFIKFYKRH